MTKNRKIEVFTAGCPLCDETVKLVNELTCPTCDVTVYNLQKEGMDKAREYGINTVPTVVVDGKILDCCAGKRPDAHNRRAAGIRKPVESPVCRCSPCDHRLCSR